VIARPPICDDDGVGAGEGSTSSRDPQPIQDHLLCPVEVTVEVAAEATAALVTEAGDLLQARQVATLFGRTLRTLSNWEATGRLKPIRVHGRRYFRRRDIEALIEKYE